VSPTWRGWLERVERWSRALENGLIVLLLALLILLSSYQIVLRNAFSASLSWGDELVRLQVLWLVLLGAVAASRDGRQLRIDVLSRLLPERLIWLADSIAAAFTAGICSLLTWQSWRFVEDSRNFGDRLLGDWPAWVFQLILPVGFAIIAYRYAVRAATTVRDRP
jgi:TRAP-type C4-dicarboxylate transport system permease small subunit